jgi:hypothetical protein
MAQIVIVVSHCELLVSGGGLDKRSFLAELRGVAGEAERNPAEAREAAGAGAERGAGEAARGEPAARQQQQVRGHTRVRGRRRQGAKEAMAARGRGEPGRRNWRAAGMDWGSRGSGNKNERFSSA